MQHLLQPKRVPNGNLLEALLTAGANLETGIRLPKLPGALYQLLAPMACINCATTLRSRRPTSEYYELIHGPLHPRSYYIFLEYDYSQ